MIVQSSEVSVTATSPLGAMSLQVSGSYGVTIDVAEAEIPELPEGMAVDGVMLICVRLAMPVTRELSVRVRAIVGQNGVPESGEWLESMAFASDEGVLQVAMRDSEWLAANGIDAEHMQYEPQGFEQSIGEAPAGTALYISMAWRVDDGATVANDLSTWFAADLALPD